MVLLVLAAVGCFAGAWVLYVLGKRGECYNSTSSYDSWLSREGLLLVVIVHLIH